MSAKNNIINEAINEKILLDLMQSMSHSSSILELLKLIGDLGKKYFG